MTAPTKQPLPGTEQDDDRGKQPLPSAEQPPTAPKQTPYGDDVEEAAELLIEQARRDVATLAPIDRYDTVVWWQQVHTRTAELLHTVIRGEPLAELAEKHTYRQVEAMLAKEGTRVSDSTISKLIGAWRAWKQRAPQQ